MQIDGPFPFATTQAIAMQRAAAIPLDATPTRSHQVVAGKVAEKVTFDEVEISPSQPLQLYTRSADRIEAATRIATGQQLDIQV